MKSEKKDQTLVEKHALNRLHQVEKDHRKPYVKPPHHFNWQGLAMFIIMVIVLLVMLTSIL